MLIEQAVFTSCRGERMEGYQLASHSPGVTREQADELSAWGPAHDSLLHPECRSGSINFHRLGDGTLCVSKTVPSGSEYSGRNGPRIYTTCLLVQPELFARYANQPFRVLDAVMSSGHLRVLSRLSEDLPSIRIRGRASVTMTSLLAPLSDERSRSRVFGLIEALAVSELLLVHGAESFRTLLDWIFNLLPVECRIELTFSTGLKYSPQRQFRLMAAPDDKMEREHLARQTGGGVLPLRDVAPVQQHESTFLAQLHDRLRLGHTHEVVALLNQPRPDLTLSSVLTT